MKDKLEEYALIAEVISAIAIVVSLVFVGIQLNHGNEETALNTKAIQSTVRQSMLEADIASLYIYLDHPYLMNRVNIPPEQEYLVKAAIIAFIRMRENYWLQYEDGLLDQATWLSYREPLVNVVFQSQIGRDTWKNAGFTPEFRKDIDGWISTLSLPDITNVMELTPPK